MYSAFVLIPQFVETPVSNGYGFGSSVTEAGLFLIPSTLAMMIASPLGGRLSGRFGSKVPLVLGSTITMLAFVLLARRPLRALADLSRRRCCSASASALPSRRWPT